MKDKNVQTGVIFDLDGTLLDTLEDITDAVNAAFAPLGYEATSVSQLRKLIGEGLMNLLRLASGESDTEKISHLVELYRPEYLERMLHKTRLYAGMAQVLDMIVESAMPMCVLSNKPHAFTKPICEAMLSRWPFVHFQGSVDDRPRKPDPGMALELAKKMQLDPANVYFVGDSDVDVLTGHNAGMKSVGVTWGYRDRGVLEATTPSFMLDAPNQLLGVLMPHRENRSG